MRPFSLKRIFGVLGLLCVAIPAAAQSGLTGRVTESGSGAPIVGARVQASSGGRTSGLSTTGENGEYRISNVTAGTYDVRVTRIGYQMRTVTGVQVGTGFATADVTMTLVPSQLNQVITTASRAPEKVIDAPASVSVVSTVQIEERPSINVADHVVALPGIDVARGGLMRSNIVARGFNNIFSGALMTLTDNRFAFVPSLRVNIPYLNPTTNEDIDRIEVVLGPGAALYGPNTTSGVMATFTKSPFSSPGTTVALDAGNQGVFRGAVRTAWVLNPKFAIKGTYDAFRGREWDFVPTDTIGEQKKRDRELRRDGGELRLDFRPTASSEIIANYGRSHAGSAIEPTGLGPAQIKNWVYQNYQLRARYERLFAQVFLNNSDAGETFLLQSVRPTTTCPLVSDLSCIIDQSSQLAAQVQHGVDLGTRQRFLYGMDYIKTMPKTEGTVNGRNEADDEISEFGGYLHSTTQLNPKFELTAAARLDKHSRLEKSVFSPRLALVFKPVENHNLRLTYNRAFSTPSTNNLFLDRIARQQPPLFDIRALGVPSTGLQFKRDCAAGLGGLCMQVFTPFGGTGTFEATNPYAASLNAAKAGVQATLTAQFTAGFKAQGFSDAEAGARGAGLAAATTNFLVTRTPSATDIGTTLIVPGLGAVTPAQLLDVDRLKPTIHTAIETGYKGIIGDRLQLSLDLWHENRKNFVGPLTLETPLVFMDRTTLNTYLATQLTGFFQAAGFPAAQASGQAALVAAGLSCALPGNTRTNCTGTGSAIPVGVVNFNTPLAGKDLIVTYRNYGNLNLWGSDLGTELRLDGGWSMRGTYSFVNKKLFTKAEVGGGLSDISLNAPANKHSVALLYRDADRGISGEVRERHVDGFNSIAFIGGEIKAYTLLDANFSMRPDFLRGAIWSINGSNLLNKRHQEFSQGSLIGRLIMTRVQVAF